MWLTQVSGHFDSAPSREPHPSGALRASKMAILPFCEDNFLSNPEQKRTLVSFNAIVMAGSVFHPEETSMVEKIDLQGSSALTMANKVAKICMPLRDLGISGFQYTKKFTDGSRYILCDRPELMQYFYEECFYPLTWYDHNKPLSANTSGFEFWPINSLYNTPEQESLASDMNKLFHINQSITYLSKSLHSWEIFRFFSDSKLIYCVSPRILFHFMFYFRENMRELIVNAQHEKIHVPLAKENINVHLSKENENCVLKRTPVKRYYLHGELGKSYLTAREKDCLYWCTEGKNSEETSIILGIGRRTVENNIQKIKEKLNCYKQSQLARVAIKLGIFVE
jgi:DNA-binding CsgD family transcriptional regulator